MDWNLFSIHCIISNSSFLLTYSNTSHSQVGRLSVEHRHRVGGRYEARVRDTGVSDQGGGGSGYRPGGARLVQVSE